jgi:hypothetical protein
MTSRIDTETRPPTLEECPALIFVAAHRLKHGRGPTFSELARMMGWEGRREVNREVRRLRAAGLRWRRDQERSLKVPPWALRQALAVLRASREARP